ncbi:hypothetical protein JCM10213_001896 [Rhodosporidiobolus nylandii]
MLLSSPDITLTLAAFLDAATLSSLSLANRSFHTLLRPRLFSRLSLGWFRWPIDESWGIELARRELDQVLASPERLSSLRHLAIYEHERWANDPHAVKKLVELLEKTDLDILEIVQHNFAVEHGPSIFDWKKLWAAMLEQQNDLRELRLWCHRGPLERLDRFVNLERLILGKYALEYVHPVVPPRLRSLVIDDMTDASYPELTVPTSKTPRLCPLSHLGLDLFRDGMGFGSDLLPDIFGTRVHFRDLSKLLELFAGAPDQTSLSLGSSPRVDWKREPRVYLGTFTSISYGADGTRTSEEKHVESFGVDGEPISDEGIIDGADEIIALLEQLGGWFPGLQRFTFFLNPTSGLESSSTSISSFAALPSP